MTEDNLKTLEGSIEEMNHAVLQITKMESGIAKLEEKYGKLVVDVSTPRS